MISTLLGKLPLTLFPTPELEVSERGRAQICTVRGEVLGQRVNAQITLDVNSGEVLIMTPGNFVGSFRIGDLVAAHVQTCVAYAMRERQEAGDAAQTH